MTSVSIRRFGLLMLLSGLVFAYPSPQGLPRSDLYC